MLPNTSISEGCPVSPGWNDPPAISANSKSGTCKRVLNRRVAFPLSSDNGNHHTRESSAMLTQVLANISTGLADLPSEAVMKDMEQFARNWNDPSCTLGMQSHLLRASEFVKLGDGAGVMDIQRTLTTLPATGWFTILLHRIISLLNDNRRDC